MKIVNIFILLISLVGFVSCEKEADPIDFVNKQDFIDGLEGMPTEGETPPTGGGETPIGSGDPMESGNPYVPTSGNPILLGQANGADFNMISADMREEDNAIFGRILTMVFKDSLGNQVSIFIPNPETKTYIIANAGPFEFDVIYFDASSGESFTTRETSDSFPGQGQIMLSYTVTTGGAEVSASFFEHGS